MEWLLIHAFNLSNNFISVFIFIFYRSCDKITKRVAMNYITNFGLIRMLSIFFVSGSIIL